jgi:hypothetical protein
MILFLMAGLMHSRLAQATQDTDMPRHQRGTFNANT